MVIKLATLIVVVRYDISGDEVRDSSQSVTCTTPKMATGAVFGKIEEFSSNKEDWSNYVERLNHFFKANAITTNEQKQSVFLSVIGPTTYKLLRSLVSPEKPGDKSFKDLVKKLSDHFNPTPSEIV